MPGAVVDRVGVDSGTYAVVVVVPIGVQECAHTRIGVVLDHRPNQAGRWVAVLRQVDVDLRSGFRFYWNSCGRPQLLVYREGRACTWARMAQVLHEMEQREPK